MTTTMTQDEAMQECCQQFPDGIRDVHDDGCCVEGIYTDSQGDEWSISYTRDGSIEFFDRRVASLLS